MTYVDTVKGAEKCGYNFCDNMHLIECPECHEKFCSSFHVNYHGCEKKND